MAYDAPIHDMAFTLQAVAGLPKLEGLPGFEAYDADLIAPILEEAGKLARDVLAPLNQPGDAAGAQLTEDGVKELLESFGYTVHVADHREAE